MKNRLSRVIFGITFFLFCTPLAAQTDTLQTQVGKVATTPGTLVTTDSSAVKAPREHSPRRAALYSAVLPGLGQAYNRKYWKIPVIYALGGGIGYAIYKNNRNYQEFRLAYRMRLEGDTTLLPLYNLTQLQQSRDYWHRFRDLSIVGAVAIYALQVIDATVDAHLFGFKQKINDDLTFEVRPQPWMGVVNGRSVNGVSLTARF